MSKLTLKSQYICVSYHFYQIEHLIIVTWPHFSRRRNSCCKKDCLHESPLSFWKRLQSYSVWRWPIPLQCYFLSVTSHLMFTMRSMGIVRLCKYLLISVRSLLRLWIKLRWHRAESRSSRIFVSFHQRMSMEPWPSEAAQDLIYLIVQLRFEYRINSKSRKHNTLDWCDSVKSKTAAADWPKCSYDFLNSLHIYIPVCKEFL